MVREMENYIPHLRKIILKQIEEAIRTTQRKDFSPEVQVHELRKNFKRIRSLVRLLKANLTEQEFHTLNEHIGNLGRILTLQRESNVNLATFLQFENSIDTEVSSSTKEIILDILSRDVQEAYSNKDSQYQKTIMGLSFQLSKLKDWLQFMPIRDFSRELVSSSIDNTLNKTIKLFNDSRCSMQVEILHKWRRFNKHLYFQIRFSKLLPIDDNRVLLDELNQLNEILGQEHDLYVLNDHLRSRLQGIVSTDELAKIKTFIGHKRYLLEKEALSLGKAIYSTHTIAYYSNKKTIQKEYNDLKLVKPDLIAKV